MITPFSPSKLGTVRSFGDLNGVGFPFMDQELLANPPLAPTAQIFALQAIRHVGRSMFDNWSEWESARWYPAPALPPFLTGEHLGQFEPAPQEPKPLPPRSIAASDYDDGSRRHRLNEAARADYDEAMAIWQQSSADRLARFQAVIEDDIKYSAAWSAGIVANEDAIAGINAAVRRLAQAVMDGVVSPYIRTYSDMEPMSLHDWANPDLLVTISRTGAVPFADGKSAHVFLHREELENGFPLAADPEDDLRALGIDHLSPYMRLMLHVIRKLKITPGNQPKALALEAEITAAAPLFGLTVGKGMDIIERSLGTMAMFLREK